MTHDTAPSAIDGSDTIPTPVCLAEGSPAARNRPLLLAALALHAVRVATVNYAGSGDEGGIEGVDYDTPAGTTFDGSAKLRVFAARSHFEDGQWRDSLVEQEVDIDQALRDFADEVLELVHGGWENGDGGSGSVILDSEAGTVRIEHHSYFTDSDYWETEL